jgi:hypothetical protein
MVTLIYHKFDRERWKIKAARLDRGQRLRGLFGDPG